MNEHRIARRTLIAGAGLGHCVPGIAPAQAAGSRPSRAGRHLEPRLLGHKGDVKLYLCRKRVGAPAAGAASLPVLFLVHGSSLSARSSYDLQVPGGAEYSLMDVFARYGFDVWTMDHEGYGHSSMTNGSADIASGVEDLKAAMDVLVARNRPQ